MKRKTISALVYPAILIALALVLVSIIVLKVVPAFSEFYGQFGRELPLVTRIIVAVSDFVRAQFLLIIVGAGRRRPSAFWPGCGSRASSARFDRLLLRAAGARARSARKFATSQMARTLATLLGGGIPLVNALDIAARSIGNRYMARRAGDGRRSRCARARRFAAALPSARRVPGRGGQDGRSRRVHRRAAGDAQQPRRLLRRGDRDRRGAVRHAGRAGAARHHGHRDRGPAAGAVHAAVPADARCSATAETDGEASLDGRPTRLAGRPSCDVDAADRPAPTSTRAEARRRRAGSPSATGSSSSTWTRSGSTRSCSGRSRRT